MKPHLQCGAAGVTIQPHQILRLSRKKTHILSPYHIWNVIYSARSNRCHHPTSPNTAPATKNDSTAVSSSHMKPYLQCAEQQVSRSNLTKYCACHAERLAYLVLIAYETSFTVRGATDVTSQPRQILRLSRRKTHMLNPHHISNLIYNARSNRCPPPTSANTAPATKIDTAKFQRKCPKTGETSFPMRGRSEHDPTMIRPWSEHENANRNPPRKWGYFSRSPEAFSIVKYNVLRPILLSNLHQVLHLPRKMTLELHQILRLPRKNKTGTYETSFTVSRATGVTIQPHQILRLARRKTHILSPHRIWNVIYSARSNRCHEPTSPNTAPATKNDSTAVSSSHMKRHFQCAEQQVSLSNLPKYCTCHEKWHCKMSKKISKNRWNVISNAGPIRPWSENDPRMKTQTATRLASEVTLRGPQKHFLL